MKKLILILLLIITFNAYGQLPQDIIENTVSVNTDEQYISIWMVHTEPYEVIFRNNLITFQASNKYVLQVGRDSWNVTYNNNQDGAVVSGNKFVWTGYPYYPTSTLHTVMCGYNKNYVLKYNYHDGSPFPFVIKGGHDGVPEIWNTGGVFYNIIKDVRQLTIKGVHGVRLYNNTWYDTRHDDGTAAFMTVAYNNDPDQTTPYPGSTGLKIKNNIFYQRDPNPVIYTIGGDSVLMGLECDYNVYWCENSVDNEPRFQIDLTYYSWDEWRALGYDAHSVVMNPNFNNTTDLVPTSRLDYGTNLGTYYQAGLSTTAVWGSGNPATTTQNGTWQVGARVYASGGGGSAPVAAFSADDVSVNEGATVTFTDASTNTPTSWAWNFGDEGTSTLQNPTHVYTTDGTYTVTLTATNAIGSDSEIKTDYITVNVVTSSTAKYVSTTGNNANAGTLASPWLTWQYAFDHTPSGDTCYFRGGVYANTTQITFAGYDGTYSEPTCFMNYPGEEPILDCSDQYNDGMGWGLEFYDRHNIKVKGLTIRNVFQSTTDAVIIAFFVNGGSNNITFENCVAHNIGMIGFSATESDTTYFINCDAYNICDTLTAYDPGGGGVGFSWANNANNYAPSHESYTYWYGCRGWNCSDQAWGGLSDGSLVIDHCWAMTNGFFDIPDNGLEDGMGMGFKWDTSSDPARGALVCKRLTNNLAFDNEYVGFDENYSGYVTNAKVYNNLSYRNGYDHPLGGTIKRGYTIRDRSISVDPEDHIYANNISYGNVNNDMVGITFAYFTNHFQGQASDFTVTSADFVSLDTTGMRRARKSDGSLPDTDFGRLASTSDLIDGGTYVGIDTIGDGADLGWIEWGETYPPTSPIVIYTNSVTYGTSTATTGGNVIDDGGSTVTARGVAYGTSANPSILGSHTSNGTGLGVYVSNITGLLPATTYHVRAYATNNEGTYYGDDVEFTTNSTSGLSGDHVFIGGKPIYSNGKQIIK